MSIIDTIGTVPYDASDTTRSWIESTPGMRVNGKIKPNLVVRFATDTNYVRNEVKTLYSFPFQRLDANTQSIMNLGLPGQRIPHILNWEVEESVDNNELVSTATLQILNALVKSSTVTTLETDLSADICNYSSIHATWIQNSLGTTSKVSGNTNVTQVTDLTSGFPFFEQHVKYRLFEDQTFMVLDRTGFPDPRIPNDDDNDVPDDTHLPHSDTGVGAYYVLIDKEVIRVSNLSGRIFSIPPGGRGINGIVQEHKRGALVTLLGLGELTGEWVALGYLCLDDYAPQKAILRPGTCLTSYEGYGDFPNLLYHANNPGDRPDGSSNYAFTGYWFVSGIEPQFQEDGVPKVTITLKSTGNVLDQQKISPGTMTRIKTNLGTWSIRDSGNPQAAPNSIFGAAGASRNIPGDWVDFNHWDPSLPDSYPLAIDIELSQHKKFYDHMQETNLGMTCPICQDERRKFIQEHPKNPQGNLKEARAVGKHIYKQSIRVMTSEAGPIMTYIRLMATLAAAAWEHPAMDLDLAQKFTKLPGALYDNIRNINTGLIFNGQIDTKLTTDDQTYDWTTPGYDDERMYNNRIPLTCPFSSTYDKAPFGQPMTDLADVNGAHFWVNREGYPVFVPMMLSFRPSGDGYRDLKETIPFAKENYQWYMSYGSSLSAYTPSLDISQVLTQTWVTGTTAFDDTTITVPAGGTGWSSDGRRILYSGFGGNAEGLALTSGVQQVDTISMDNQILGLDWNTRPANWGVQEQTDGNNITVLNPKPQLYDGATPLIVGSSGKAVRVVQQTINFFLTRRYLDPIQDPDHPGNYWYNLKEDGKYNKVTSQGVYGLSKFLEGADFDKSHLPGLDTLTTYDRYTYLWIKEYLNQAGEAIKMDVWWYVYTSRSWDEYVAAITGLAVPMKPSGAPVPAYTSANYPKTPKYVIDDMGMNQAVGKWAQNFTRTASMVGNRAVDISINQASTRSISSAIADPRVQPGDTIWATVPGHLSTGSKPPFTNGIYTTSITRQMDLLNPAYTATYSGTRFRGQFGKGLSDNISTGYRFISSHKDHTRTTITEPGSGGNIS